MLVLISLYFCQKCKHLSYTFQVHIDSEWQDYGRSHSIVPIRGWNFVSSGNLPILYVSQLFTITPQFAGILLVKE